MSCNMEHAKTSRPRPLSTVYNRLNKKPSRQYQASEFRSAVIVGNSHNMAVGHI